MAEEKKEEVLQDEKKEVKDVHELVWVEGKGWGCRRQGSEKIIKYFRTKIEGTQYILRVSENRGTRVVIRLKNGKFQKFENATRALAYIKESGDNE